MTGGDDNNDDGDNDENYDNDDDDDVGDDVDNDDDIDSQRESRLSLPDCGGKGRAWSRQ